MMYNVVRPKIDAEKRPKIVIRDNLWGVLVLLICVQILVRLDCFSHRITMEVWKPARWKTAKNSPKRAHPWKLIFPVLFQIWRTK